MDEKGEKMNWIFGDNVDTDVIIPARYLNTSEPEELAKHCMEDIDLTFAKDDKSITIHITVKKNALSEIYSKR